MLPVILAGGSGSRLWPDSRALYPKQFIALTGSHTLFQQTLLRLEGLDIERPIVVCNEEHRFLVAEQLRQINVVPTAILLEPEGKNTAPAIALAAMYALQHFSDQSLLVLPADHAITNITAFHDAVNNAIRYAKNEYLVTFGVKPTKPETGYGYIKSGQVVSIDHENGINCEKNTGYNVEQFIEKPVFENAKRYVNSGLFYWNAGMFVFLASKYILELERYQLEVVKVCRRALAAATRDFDFVRIDREVFSRCPDTSIDYALMEHTESAVVVPLNGDWSDVGSWSSLWELETHDQGGNVIKGDVITEGSKGCYLQSRHKLLAAVGVEDLVIVDTPDAVLVANKYHVQQIKKVVEQLKQAHRAEYQVHREVHRPWGKYDSIDKGPRFHVKRITVNPGARISLQMHHHRAEHWVVVSGTAKVKRGDEIFLVAENESTFIPIGVIHSLENPGTVPLEMIEVQSGAYLGEDDIVRFDDAYGR